jgi:predicted enzyme related to lactoylglutathione lyase
MGVHFQVTYDSTDPHRLAAFYADALDYVIEDHSTLIRTLLDQGQVTDADTVTIDGQLRFEGYAAIRDPDAPHDEFTDSGKGGRMLFQKEPTGKAGKNRVHIDIHVGDRRKEVVERLTALGATYLWEASQGPLSWVTMADPDGNEFCVA